MAITSLPRTNIQLLPAGQVTAFADRNDLIVGQLGTGASATSGALNKNLESATKAELLALLGVGDLYWRVRNWQEGNDGFSPLSVIGLSPAAGTAAESTITFTGPATADGTLTVSVVDEEEFTVTVTISDTDTETEIATATAAAFTALTNSPPFTAASALGVVTFTAVDLGTTGNHYSIKATGSVAGVGYTLAGWSSGATNPSTTGIFDPIDAIRYTGISWPEAWQSDISEVTDLLDTRFNEANDILDGVAFTGHTDTYSNNLAFVGALNSQSLVVGGNNLVTGGDTEGGAIVQPADWTMAYFQGVRAKRLTKNAPISTDIVALNSPLDAIGGAHTASLPYFNTPLNDAPVTSPANLFSNTEQIALAEAGFTTYGVNRANNGMITSEVVTTRTTDSAGNANTSFLYLNFVDTSSNCREVFYNALKATFAQSRLVEGLARPGYSVANEETIRAALGDIYRALSEVVLLESGDKAERFFGENTTVAIKKATRLVDITSLLPIVSQLGTINYPLTLTFTIENTGTQIGI